jgi:hypothetical protein
MTVIRALHRGLSGRSLPQVALGALGYSPAQADLIAIGLWYAWSRATGQTLGA